MEPAALTDAAREVYTVQQYGGAPAIDGVARIGLSRFVDDGGSFFELGRLSEAGEMLGAPGFRVRQISFSEVLPGAVKAFHLHCEQSDLWFAPPSQRLLLVLCDVRRGSPTEGAAMRFVLGDGQAFGVRIPPGVAHGCANLWTTPASVIYFSDRHFSAGSDTDEGRLPWDFLGADLWTVQPG